MKFIITGKAPEEEVEYDLPRYSQHDLDTGTVYHKLDLKDGQLIVYGICISYAGDRIEITTDKRSQYLRENGHYYLGLNRFASSEDEWLSALNSADYILGRIK